MGPAWDFAVAPQRPVPGVSSMVGYRAVDVPDSVHVGLSSARLTFIVSLDDGIRSSFEPSDLATTARKRVLVAGLHTRPSHVEQTAGQAGVQLAVHPLAARALFGFPAAELAELDVDGAALLGGRATELADRLAVPDLGWRNTFEEVTAVLRGRWSSSDPVRPRPELRRAWDALTSSAGQAPIATVAQAAGMSTRHLGTLFRAEVGLAPKAVARLTRFEAVIRALARRAATWSRRTRRRWRLGPRRRSPSWAARSSDRSPRPTTAAARSWCAIPRAISGRSGTTRAADPGSPRPRRRAVPR